MNYTLKCSYARSRRQAPTTPLGILSRLTYETERKGNKNAIIIHCVRSILGVFNEYKYEVKGAEQIKKILSLSKILKRSCRVVPASPRSIKNWKTGPFLSLFITA